MHRYQVRVSKRHEVGQIRFGFRMHRFLDGGLKYEDNESGNKESTQAIAIQTDTDLVTKFENRDVHMVGAGQS